MHAYDSGERCRLISLSLSISIYLSLSNLSYILVRRCSLSPPPCPSNVYRLVYLSNLTIKEPCWGCTHECDAKSGGLFFSPPFPEKKKLPRYFRCRALKNISFQEKYPSSYTNSSSLPPFAIEGSRNFESSSERRQVAAHNRRAMRKSECTGQMLK